MSRINTFNNLKEPKRQDNKDLIGKILMSRSPSARKGSAAKVVLNILELPRRETVPRDACTEHVGYK